MSDGENQQLSEGSLITCLRTSWSFFCCQPLRWECTHLRQDKGASCVNVVMNIILNRIREATLSGNVAVFKKKRVNTSVDNVFKTMEKLVGMQVEILSDDIKQVESMRDLLCSNL